MTGRQAGDHKGAIWDQGVCVLLQCDQMDRLLFNIWPFTTMKICQSRFKILPKQIQNFAKSTKTNKILAKFYQNGENLPNLVTLQFMHYYTSNDFTYQKASRSHGVSNVEKPFLPGHFKDFINHRRDVVGAHLFPAEMNSKR